ncbi:MAG: exodeoxyribonuclease VII large subunit [Rickettsiales bacterium]|jgi:exodeoxyribonuclease VII large subunit|nr:exodeoxyribonuclease VII large subunit [Rickettsiales bacterium]
MQLIPEYTVSELAETIKTVIEGALYYVRVLGEVSGLRISSAGHSYFNLKDAGAILNVVYFRNSGAGPRLGLEDGLGLVLWGRLTIYREKSTYQVIAEGWEVSGVGSLLKIIEDRKKKLESEGLFARKRPLPGRIRRVGIVTAANGAAIRDIEACLRDRLPLESVILYPSLVQGQEADASIMAGIRHFNRFEPTDVLVITRGGGSVEDLMCFNSEPLAREIFGSRIPVITAIGHEIDWTLADYVSDLRLATPTAVASFLSPLEREAELRMDLTFRRIVRNSSSLLRNIMPRVEAIFRALRQAAARSFSGRFHFLGDLERRLSVFSREKILRQGYAILRKDGKMIARGTPLVPGDVLAVEMLARDFRVTVL